MAEFLRFSFCVEKLISLVNLRVSMEPTHICIFLWVIAGVTHPMYPTQNRGTHKVAGGRGVISSHGESDDLFFTVSAFEFKSCCQLLYVTVKLVQKSVPPLTKNYSKKTCNPLPLKLLASYSI